MNRSLIDRSSPREAIGKDIKDLRWKDSIVFPHTNRALKMQILFPNDRNNAIGYNQYFSENILFLIIAGKFDRLNCRCVTIILLIVS